MKQRYTFIVQVMGICYVSTSKNSFSPLKCLEMYNLSAPLLIVFAEETFQNVLEMLEFLCYQSRNGFFIFSKIFH